MGVFLFLLFFLFRLEMCSSELTDRRAAPSPHLLLLLLLHQLVNAHQNIRQRFHQLRHRSVEDLHHGREVDELLHVALQDPLLRPLRLCQADRPRPRWKLAPPPLSAPPTRCALWWRARASAIFTESSSCLRKDRNWRSLRRLATSPHRVRPSTWLTAGAKQEACANTGTP